MEPTECSETSDFNIQTPGKYPEESTPYLQHGESLKTTIVLIGWVGGWMGVRLENEETEQFFPLPVSYSRVPVD
jgi:hypothetical protein